MENLVNNFKRDGYVVLENYFSNDECDKLREHSKELIDNLDISTHPKTVFSTRENQEQLCDRYFLDSYDKTRFFFEESAFDEKGQIDRPKHLAINKIGHGVAHSDSIYKAATYKQVIKDIAKALDFVEPVVVQSMVIFKQPLIGGVVTPHEDCTFLLTEPSKVIGLWIALEDADEENGCLSFIPGSHNGTRTERRMIRNPDKSGTVTFNQPHDQYDDSKFKAVPIKKGSAIVLHGHVVHSSPKNLSSRSREIYTFHIAESHNTKWCEENWIPLSETYQFSKLFEN